MTCKESLQGLKNSSCHVRRRHGQSIWALAQIPLASSFGADGASRSRGRGTLSLRVISYALSWPGGYGQPGQAGAEEERGARLRNGTRGRH
jgi:hypothetical protein